VNLYVDDLIYTGNDCSMMSSICDEFRRSMMSEFDMTDLGRMKYFLGVEIMQNSNGIFVCQRKYAHEVLSHFGVENCNAIKNPIVPGTKLSKDDAGTKVDATMFEQVVGSFMYLMYGVSLISRFMSIPTESHWFAAKRIRKGKTQMLWHTPIMTLLEI